MKSILFLFLFISYNLCAQNVSFYENKHLYELEEKIKKGDFKAFVDIAAYFDSKKSVIEFLGHHVIHTNESAVSKRIVTENSFFLENEVVIDSTTTTKQFQDFIIKNRKKMVFSDLGKAFIITPFNKRRTTYLLQQLTVGKLAFLESKRDEILNSEYMKSAGITKFLEQKNPEVLLRLSSLLLKNRYRFNEYKDGDEQIVNLIRLLIRNNIAVPNETGAMNFHVEKDFYDISRINLLVFFANHYKDYKWNDRENCFVNRKLNVLKTDKETELFDLLASESEAVALKSFISLTRCNPEKVVLLADQYDHADITFNYSLPTFSYRFLKQLVYLTEYCERKNLDYNGSKELRNDIELLKSKLSFTERRKREDQLIEHLSMNEITAFEYWCLIYEKNNNLTFSAGRILDKFYSKNWKQIVQNPLYLETYLLKSFLFKKIGIIGFCNNYLVKFTGNYHQSHVELNSLKTKAPQLAETINEAH